MSTMVAAFDGSRIDGSLFTDIADFARDTPWLNDAALCSTNAGLAVFAALLVLSWWKARRTDAPAMAAALAAPVAVVIAFVVAEVVKKLVAETRPCLSVPHAFIIETCPAADDYAFPSGHTAIAAATVGALFLLGRRLSVIAAVFAVIEGFTRVYVGAHYPHDVLASFVLAFPIAVVVVAFARRAAAPTVARLRTGAAALVLGTGEPRPEVERTHASRSPRRTEQAVSASSGHRSFVGEEIDE